MIHPAAHDAAGLPGAPGPSLEDRRLPQRSGKPLDTTTDSPRPGRPGAAPLATSRAEPDANTGRGGPELDGEEELLFVLRGIGAMMFLTTERMIVARDGFERRPRTGIQSFPLDEIRHLRLELGASPSGRIALWTAGDHEAVSMFFDARSLDRAHELIDRARPLIAQRRRSGAGARPVRPPSGPADPGPVDPA